MTHQKIIAYLENRNWEFNSEDEKFVKYKAPSNLGFEEDFILPIPKNQEYLDYERFILNNLQILADIYEINIDELIVIIKEENSILSLRIHDEDTDDGKISFHRFDELVEGLKDLLIDAAAFVIDPGIQLKNKASEAERYLNYCKFLQTEKGSFVAKVELPEKQTIKEHDLFEESINASLINSRLKSFIEYVNNSVFNSEQDFSDEYLETHQENINLDLLIDFEKIYERTKSKNIDFYFNDIVETRSISTNEIYNNNLVKLSNLINRVKETIESEETVTLTGRIISLKSTDPDGSRNEITFGALLDQMPIKVKARLNSDDYQLAVDAHKEKRDITIRGLLKELKTIFRFLEVYEFSVES